MENRKGKNKLILLIIIFLLLLLCGIGVFILYEKRMFFTDGEKNGYKMVKILNYSEKEDNRNGTSIIETKDYYILEYSVDYNRTTILYDKNGKDVTLDMFGVDNIEYIDGISYLNDIIYIVKTTDEKYGLYDSDFKEIIKLSDYVIEVTNKNEYFIVGDPISNPNIIERLENTGVYNKEGKVIIPREYERMYSGNSSYDVDKVVFYARKNGKYGIIDDKNNVIIPFEYDMAPSKITLGLGEIFKSKEKNYFILYKNGKYGLVDENNRAIINFDKENLFYNKYADAVIEKVYSNSDVVKLNVYNLEGEVEKEIVLNEKFKATFDAYYYKLGYTNLILYDNEYMYILNNKFDYEKSVKPSSIGHGMNTDLYLASDSIYMKGDNDKYKIYKVGNNTLFSNEDFYSIGNDFISDGFVLCKNRLEDGSYSGCGIIGNDGNIVLDFVYSSDYGTSLRKNDEYVDFEYNEETRKYDIKRYEISGNCVNGKEYFMRDNIIHSDSSIYDLNCNKIADDVTNYYVLDDNLVMTEKFEDNVHNTYKIYNISTGKLADIVNDDNAVITNDIRSESLNNEPIIVTDKGIYKILGF